MARDVIVVVQRDALPVEKESLDILFISTTGAQPVNVYRDAAAVEAVYGEDGPTPNAKIVRKVTTLLNQGKTTLAETLTNKFKIVGFEPPSTKPAQTAEFIIAFVEGQLASAIKSGSTVYARIGGDENAVVALTAASKITTTSELAALFAGTGFTKGGKTYGNTTVAVISATGTTYDIHFSRPAPVKIWVRVYNLVTNNQFPLDGIEQIKQSLVNHIGGNVRGGLDIGQAVICVTLPTEVLKVSGVVDFDLQISSDGENYSWNNIAIAAREKAVTEEGLVDVS